MSGLKEQVIVLTGASSGIGAAAARALSLDGARVVLGARREDLLIDLCSELTASGGEATYRVTDLRREAEVEGLIEHALATWGRIDALVNNAAFGTVRTIAEGRTDEWRATFETNVLGTLTACRASLRHMLPAGTGTILNVTSASAYEAWPYLSVYAGSKAAVHTISNGMRAEVAPAGVRVMTLEIHNVGGTDFAGNFDASVLPEAIQRWQALGLLRRDSPMLTAADIGRAMVFMLSQPDPVSIHHLSVRSRAN